MNQPPKIQAEVDVERALQLARIAQADSSDGEIQENDRVLLANLEKAREADLAGLKQKLETEKRRRLDELIRREDVLFAEVNKLKAVSTKTPLELETLSKINTMLKSIEEERIELQKKLGIPLENKKTKISELLEINLENLYVVELKNLQVEIGKLFVPDLKEEETTILSEMLEKIDNLIAKRERGFEPEIPKEEPVSEIIVTPAVEPVATPIQPTTSIVEKTSRKEEKVIETNRKIVLEVEEEIQKPLNSYSNDQLKLHLRWLKTQLRWVKLGEFPGLKERIETRATETRKWLKKPPELQKKELLPLNNINIGRVVSYQNKNYEITELPNKENNNRYKLTSPGNPVLLVTTEQITEALQDGKAVLLPVEVTPEVEGGGWTEEKEARHQELARKIPILAEKIQRNGKRLKQLVEEEAQKLNMVN